jgi:uncharacterized protein (TIGR03084 family)
VDIFDDLVAEQERLEEILAALPADAWARESGAVGWTVADVVLHLAQTEESVVLTTSTGSEQRDFFAGGALLAGSAGVAGGALLAGSAGVAGGALDEVMDAQVRAERADAAEVFQRWRKARRAAVDALRAADPRQSFAWAATPLRPKTLATTRLAEHWAHGLDITGPLGVPFPDTDRLRHIAWLAHSTLPYAFRFAGQEPRDVYCELTAPDGSTWSYGPTDADSRIDGPAGAFCRVGAQRLAPTESGLTTTGPYAGAALAVLRTYAG